MKLGTFIATIALLFVCQAFSNVEIKSNQHTEQTATLTVFNIDHKHKTLLVGDGLSPIYWRFRVPDSKWNAVNVFIKEEDQVCLTWIGPELYDLASFDSSEGYDELCVLKGLTVFKPVKLF